MEWIIFEHTKFFCKTELVIVSGKNSVSEGNEANWSFVGGKPIKGAVGVDCNVKSFYNQQTVQTLGVDLLIFTKK